MLRVHCQGCERQIDAELNAKEEVIVPVQLEVQGGGYGRWPRSSKADLCPRCLHRALGAYFGVLPDGGTEEELEREALLGPPRMPRYLEPVQEEAVA